MSQKSHLKIAIVTTGQPSTNPRMMKELDALLQEGYSVKVFYSYWTSWANKTDKKLISLYDPEIFVEVGGNPFNGKFQYLFSRLLYKATSKLYRFFPSLSDFALARNTFVLTMEVKKNKADLYIAHNLGALPAAANAAKKWGGKLAFDAEDYHRGEFNNISEPNYQLTTRIENRYIPVCNLVTAASPLIAAAYKKLFPAMELNVINNVFSKKYLQSHISKAQSNTGLSIFWFSQTVGTNRGLENVIKAINELSDYNISFHLMGECSQEYKQTLLHLTKRPNTLFFLDPVNPDEIFSIASQFDIGLASEIPHSDNRNFCLTNKIFTYLLAGNCILASDTLAQKDLLEQYPTIGLLYSNTDSNSLVEALTKLYCDRYLLQQYKNAALELAAEQFNWEKESKKLINKVSSII